MLIRDARFVSSNTQLAACPPPTLPEYAFIGRSNVGKSSLLNMLTQRNGLAKTTSLSMRIGIWSTCPATATPA